MMITHVLAVLNIIMDRVARSVLQWSAHLNGLATTVVLAMIRSREQVNVTVTLDLQGPCASLLMRPLVVEEERPRMMAHVYVTLAGLLEGLLDLLLNATNVLNSIIRLALVTHFVTLQTHVAVVAAVTQLVVASAM